MPFAGFKDFDDCVQKMKKKQGYSEEVAKKVCGKLQARHEQKEKVKESCITSLLSSERFFKNLSPEERKIVAQSRCENLANSLDLALVAKFYDISNEDKSSMYLIARGITSDHIDFDLLEKYKDNLLNTKLIWRHLHPADKKNPVQSPIYGYLRDYRIETREDGKKELICKFEVFGIFDYQKQLQDFIKETFSAGKPLGVSARFFIFGNSEKKNDKLLHIEEFSITPVPACDECVILSIQKEEEVKEEMTDVDEKELEAVIAALDKKLEDKIAKISELEEKLEEQNNTIRELKIELDKKEKEIEFLNEKKPLIEKILELTEFENEDERKEVATNLAALPVKLLEFQIKMLEKPKVPEPVVQVQNEIKPEDEKKELSEKEILSLLGIEVKE